MNSSDMHWSQMIDNSTPLDPIISDNITCIIYHPLHLNGNIGEVPDKEPIMKFIKLHDKTDSGNITELSLNSFTRILSTPCFIGILFKNGEIIGTMFTLIFRTTQLLTTYTTFLCIHKSEREQGLAMILIRSIMKEGYLKYGITHGYYMSYNTHHDINVIINSWYRPINISKLSIAGFTLQDFSNIKLADTKQRLYYHVVTPKILPIKATIKSYQLFTIIAKHGTIYLTPTKQEYKWLLQCFDIYLVGTSGLFMLFPISCIISSTKIYSANLSLMIGDVLPQVLWIAKENNYDLLYGWYTGDITTEKVSSIKGLTTVATQYLEFYNTKQPTLPDNFLMPIF